MLAVDNVVEVTTLLVPEPLVERFAGTIGRLANLRRQRIAFLPQPVANRHNALYQSALISTGFPRLGVTTSRRPSRPSTSAGSPPAPVFRSPSAGSTPMPNRVPAMWCSKIRLQLRHQLAQRGAILGGPEVAMNGVEEPHGRIRRVIQPFPGALREHVRINPSRT